MLEKRHNFHTITKAAKAKKVYYLCMEFLMGRSLKNSVFNLGVVDAFENALKDYDAPRWAWIMGEKLWPSFRPSSPHFIRPPPGSCPNT